MWRHAFTLIELLVVIAIIAVLCGLLLPAVQRVRQTAAKSQCLNNLKQLGLALNAHHTQHQRYPVGCTEYRIGNDLTKRQLAWSVYLLPYVEQQNVFDQLDLSKAFDHATNAAVAATPLSVYRCPASRNKPAAFDGRGTCDYGGIYGERISGPSNTPRGMMVHDKIIREKDVIDGLSVTLAIGEDTKAPDGQWINGRNVFEQAFVINQGPAFDNELRSDHFQGAHGVFADGAAKFLNQRMSLPILAAICTRNGGEAVGDLD